MVQNGSNTTIKGLGVIAQAGTAHQGELSLAMDLVGMAKGAGATSVRFQMLNYEAIELPQVPTPNGYTTNEAWGRGRSLRLTDGEWSTLAVHADETGIPLSAAVNDTHGVELLDRLEAPYIRIPSCELTNTRLLKAAGETGRPVVLSTGMATMPEIERAVKDLQATGNSELGVMHCVSQHPAPLADMNLAMIAQLRCAFGLPVGLSDHTESSHAAVMALALGATFFEKHLSPDAAGDKHACSPASLASYIQDLRDAKAALAPSKDKLRPYEFEIKPSTRRGVHASKDLPEGHVISEADLMIVRPEGPYGPNDLSKLIGMRVTQPIRQYEALRPDAIESPAHALS